MKLFIVEIGRRGCYGALNYLLPFLEQRNEVYWNSKYFYVPMYLSFNVLSFVVNKQIGIINITTITLSKYPHSNFLQNSRYYLTLVVQNIQAFDLLIDKISLSPYCFGLGQGVNDTMLEDWRHTMTDEDYCRLYGKQFILFLIYYLYILYTDSEIKMQLNFFCFKKIFCLIFRSFRLLHLQITDK